MVDSDGGELNVPLYAIYSTASDLFIQPTGDKFVFLLTPVAMFSVNVFAFRNGMGSQAIPWRQFKRDWHRIIVCPSVDGDHKKDYFVRVCFVTLRTFLRAFYFQASVDVQDAYYENTHRKNLDMPCYVIHFTAPTLLRNALPYPLKISAIVRFFAICCSNLFVLCRASKRWHWNQAHSCHFVLSFLGKLCALR